MTSVDAVAAAQVPLSLRQMQVLRLIAEGNSNPAICQRLFLGEGTVKTHLKRLFRDLKVRDRAHAVARGFELGVLVADGTVRALDLSSASVPTGSSLAVVRREVDPAKQLVAALMSLGWMPPEVAR